MAGVPTPSASSPDLMAAAAPSRMPFGAVLSPKQGEDPAFAPRVDHVETYWLLIQAQYLLIASVLVAIGFSGARYTTLS